MVLDDELANDHVLTEASPSLTLESFNLPVLSVYIRHDQLENTLTARKYKLSKGLYLIQKFSTTSRRMF